MNKWFFEFQYDDRGYGDLLLHEGNLIALNYYSRTGSINPHGKLINAIYPGIWTIREKSIATHERAMIVKIEEVSHKLRLTNPDGKWTHFLIHPDGRLPGSLGCIVTCQRYGNAEKLFKTTDKILFTQPIIPVYINTPVPMGVLDGNDMAVA